MPFINCSSCQTRYYQRRDGSRPHTCERKKQARIGPRKERTLVPCCWPECPESVPALLIKPDKYRHYQQYRIDDFGGAGLIRYPICQKHRARMREVFGQTVKLNGIKAVLRTDEQPMASRHISAPLTRLVLFERAHGCCQHCNLHLEFHEKWHADHIVPLFKGGVSSLLNLQVLCRVCHDIKSSPEKREANNQRQKIAGSKRWYSHSHKDKLIAELQAEIQQLRVQLGKA